MIYNYSVKQNNFVNNLINDSDQINMNFNINFDVNFKQTDKINKINESD